MDHGPYWADHVATHWAGFTLSVTNADVPGKQGWECLTPAARFDCASNSSVGFSPKFRRGSVFSTSRWESREKKQSKHLWQGPVLADRNWRTNGAGSSTSPAMGRLSFTLESRALQQQQPGSSLLFFFEGNRAPVMLWPFRVPILRAQLPVVTSTQLKSGRGAPQER